MRFIRLYLVGYCILIVGMGLAAWQSGLLKRMSPIWIGISVLVVIGGGIMLSVSSGKPTVEEEVHR